MERQFCWLLLLLMVLIVPSAADERSHKYKDGEPVVLWVNKVGPYNNPQETYNYYRLPFCKPRPADRAEHSWGNLGEVLQGNELINSQLDIRFKENIPRQAVCSQLLAPESAAAFQDAVLRHYWYEHFLDDLPVWGFVGEVRDAQAQVYTHKAYDISYNGPRIIMVNLTGSDLTPLKAGTSLNFTFSVTWHPTDVTFSSRFSRYLDSNFFEHQIHWFSILNSFMMVMFLTGLVFVILMRTLRKDYARYAADEEDLETAHMNEESGWKLIHGDVFRQPRHLALLSACVGTGVQLAGLCASTITITIAGTLFEERGTILTVFLVCYALTSAVGGYVSGGFYARHEGPRWIGTFLLTASLFPGTCFAIATVLNTIALCYSSLAAVPFWYIVAVLLLWGCISFPLCLVGTVLGRNWNAVASNPCRVKRIPSVIPEKQWYLRPAVLALAVGLLPFGSIFIEMYFIFTSFWNYKVYYVYGFMLLVFVILLIVTVCATVVGTYFLLNAENYQWQWTSFLMAASTSLYVFLYALHYFLYKTKMDGFFQTAFYFGYTAMFCGGLALITGAVGHLGAAIFVRAIYKNVKCD